MQHRHRQQHRHQHRHSIKPKWNAYIFTTIFIPLKDRWIVVCPKTTTTNNNSSSSSSSISITSTTATNNNNNNNKIMTMTFGLFVYKLSHNLTLWLFFLIRSLNVRFVQRAAVLCWALGRRYSTIRNITFYIQFSCFFSIRVFRFLSHHVLPFFLPSSLRHPSIRQESIVYRFVCQWVLFCLCVKLLFAAGYNCCCVSLLVAVAVAAAAAAAAAAVGWLAGWLATSTVYCLCVSFLELFQVRPTVNRNPRRNCVFAQYMLLRLCPISFHLHSIGYQTEYCGAIAESPKIFSLRGSSSHRHHRLAIAIDNAIVVGCIAIALSFSMLLLVLKSISS